MTEFNTEYLQAASGPLAFAVLGSLPPSDPLDPEFDFQIRREQHWSARLACSMLKVASSIVTATVVHPGGEADEQSLVAATRELMQRAARLTEAAVELLGLPTSDPRLPAYKNFLRQQAADVVSAQWRFAQGAGGKEVSVEQIAAMYRIVLDDGEMSKEAGLPSGPDLDEVTAKRLALVGVIPQIYQAVNCFDYFAPAPETLVEKGIRQVMDATNDGVERIASPATRPETRAMVAQSLVGKAGALYAENYKAHARRDVLELQEMDGTERARHLFIHREAGLPTDHIDLAFEKLMRRMVDMVCEAVPDLDPAPSAAPTQAAVVPQPMRSVIRGHQPE